MWISFVFERERYERGGVFVEDFTWVQQRRTEVEVEKCLDE